MEEEDCKQKICFGNFKQIFCLCRTLPEYWYKVRDLSPQVGQGGERFFSNQTKILVGRESLAPLKERNGLIYQI